MTTATRHPPITTALTIRLAVAMSLAVVMQNHATAQSGYQLPPTLRAAQDLQQQSGGVIDQLVSGSASNELRGDRPTQRPSFDRRPATNQHSATNQRQGELGYGKRDTQPVARQTRHVVQADTYSQSVDAAEQGPSNSDQAWDQILRSSAAAVKKTSFTSDTAANGLAPEPSFIEKESAKTESSEPVAGNAKTAALVKKISINLMFVLAIAFGILLIIKQWQKGRAIKTTATESQRDPLNVSQILPLANGASLHVVQGSQGKFLVAIDASGIKSVNVLNESFEDTMNQMETRQHRRQSHRSSSSSGPQLAHQTTTPPPETLAYDPIDPNEDSTEIDEKLIKLLLQRSPAA